MKKITFYIFLLFLSIFSFSCKDEAKDDCRIDEEIANLNCKVTPVCGEKGNIVGKWKLVKATEALVAAPTSIDYSCEDIIYEFRPDNKLVVTSNLEGQMSEEYEYQYKLPEACPTCLPNQNLYIGEASFYGHVSANKLEMVSPQEEFSNYEFQKYHRLLVRIK